MTQKHAIRERMCIATRKKQPTTGLLRVVSRVDTNGLITIEPDPEKILPGRGAWIEPSLEAYAIAEKRNAFGRALKIKGSFDSSAVREYIEEKRKTDH
ncbi:MAG: YlxR family protein [Corynebacterium sp.]|nr:YlxR family protein [Corynebacterium sp.]